MNSTALIITMNKFNKYFQSFDKTFVCENLDNAREELIKYLASQFDHLRIDFPDNYLDFSYVWFEEQSVNAEVFSYKIFDNNMWREPWEHEEIYQDVITTLEEMDKKIPIDFSKIYAEPNPDEEENDDFKFEHNEDTTIMDAKISDVLCEAHDQEFVKNLHVEDTVEDCPCADCLEGYKVQLAKKD